MSQLNLTDEERAMIAAMTAPHQGVGYRVASYASVLVPVTLIACYGILRSDIVAVSVAYGGLLIYMGWQMVSELRYVKLWNSVFRKIVEHESAFEKVSPGQPNKTSPG